MKRNQYAGDLRTIDGALPRGSPDNYHWAIGQGEPHFPFEKWGGDRVPFWTDYTITLIPLNNGKWIARPIAGDCLFWVNSPQFDDRAPALRAAVAQVLRLIRRNSRRPFTPYAKLSPDLARDMIAWACGLLDRPATPLFVPEPEAPPPVPATVVQTGQLRFPWCEQ